MNPKRYSRTETAGIIRQTLKAAFPGIKFSVTSKSYSGGSSIDVSWTDGPTGAQVQPILDRFSGATMNGMEDIKEYKRFSMMDGLPVEFSVDFVFGQRSLSRETVKAAAFRVALETGLPLLFVEENGNIPQGHNSHVPFKYFAKENVIAHSYGKAHADGEYHSNLIHQIARQMSYATAQPVTLPEIARPEMTKTPAQGGLVA